MPAGYKTVKVQIPEELHARVVAMKGDGRVKGVSWEEIVTEALEKMFPEQLQMFPPSPKE